MDAHLRDEELSKSQSVYSYTYTEREEREGSRKGKKGVPCRISFIFFSSFVALRTLKMLSHDYDSS